MHINGTPFVPASTRTQMVKDQLADAGKRFLLNGGPTPANNNHRDGQGRFTAGCRGGPGRPRKIDSRRFVPPLHLYQRCLDRDDSIAAWTSIVNRLGAAGARELLRNIEGENGPICFRHLAIQAIATGEKAPEQNHSNGHLSDSNGATEDRRQSRGTKKSKQ